MVRADAGLVLLIWLKRIRLTFGVEPEVSPRVKKFWPTKSIVCSMTADAATR